MRIGEEVEVVKGEYEGRRAKVRGTDGFFYHIQLLTPSGRKSAVKPVSVHRSAIQALPESVESPERV